MTTQLTPYIDSDIARTAAKAWAAAHGYRGAAGGWIYDVQGRPVAQGWFNFEAKYYAKIRDWVTVQVTAFDTFAALVGTDERYCPTLLPRSWRERYLADSFDLWAYQMGQARRAWRGGLGRCPQCGNRLAWRDRRDVCLGCKAVPA